MELCQTSSCLHSPIAICLHCQQHLCVEHLLQHNEQLVCQANIQCDEFNRITEQIEKMSFNEQFTSAEEDLNDWLNDQMKKLDKVYEEKLFLLKQAQSEVEEKLKAFKQTQRLKIADVQRRLFNSQLNKQINLEQLNQMKTTIEQLREDIHQFRTNDCSITLINNDQMNYSYKPNIDIQLKNKILNGNEIITEVDNGLNQTCDKLRKYQLRAEAKPFEYIRKMPHYDSNSSIRQKDFHTQLFEAKINYVQ
ncbi:unnamed protein product [Rotaria socialis]|nr:unnamed protein product [Rotaria socialis]CAF3321809.1 unnamed protein product [Rotaria socialis]CAF3432615.1 unnamed protein product [Rotaria socialis]CAF3725392.1 unnamed protein product [Rotaria socialis]